MTEKQDRVPFTPELNRKLHLLSSYKIDLLITYPNRIQDGSDKTKTTKEIEVLFFIYLLSINWIQYTFDQSVADCI